MGAGSISLPGAICAIGDTKGAIVPAVTILTLMGSLSAYTFSVIAKETAKHNAASFEEVWERTIGEKSIWVISACITITTFLACTAYSMIIGDLVSALALSFGAKGLLAKRSTAILAVTGGIVTPLCFLKSLAALSVTSLLGVFGVIFSSVVMGVRYFDGSYATGGKFLAGLSLQPSFGALQNGWKLDHMTFVLLSCLGTAFLAHFNAPTFYNDLKGRSPKKFNRVIAAGFGTSTLVFAAMMAFGFGTFGSSTLGNVFVNYAPADNLALLCRLATVFSITFTYPLAFVGLKKGFLNLVKKTDPSEKLNAVVVGGLLATITALSLVIDDLGFIAALTGSLMGSLIIYIFPGLMRLKSLQKDAKATLTLGEKASTYGLMGTGVVLGVVGVVISFLKQFTKALG